MNSFYTREELEKLGFRSLGNDVLLSRKVSIYGADKISIGDHVRIDDFCILSGMISLGSYIHISAYAALYGGKAGITVESFANISARSIVYAVCDDFSGKTMAGAMVPDVCRQVDERPVIIEKHTLLGANCVVLPGVRVAEGSAFGCFSLINRDSQPWTLNGGVPFRKLKDRLTGPKELERQIR